METTFKKILVPMDASPSSGVALDLAIYMAQQFQADITIAYIKVGSDSTNAQKIEEINKVIAEKNVSGIHLSFIQRNEGKIYKEIVNAAQEVHADLIIMGTHGTSGIIHNWIGSNAFRVVSSAPCPVITMQESFKGKSINTIVLPLDDSYETRQKTPTAATVAKYFKANVNVLAASKDKSNDTVTRIKTYAYQAMNYLEERGVKTNYEIEVGRNVAEITTEYADKIGADLIIIMTEQESASIFMGPYAQQMINQSKIPVMSIRPREDLAVSFAQL
jgi:nucleotide-binding universal stress UspA family protein